MKKLPDDPLMKMLRAKYPKHGPDPKPGEDLDRWTERFLNQLRPKEDMATRMIKEKASIDDICKATGLRKETVKILNPSSRKKEAIV